MKIKKKIQIRNQEQVEKYIKKKKKKKNVIVLVQLIKISYILINQDNMTGIFLAHWKKVRTATVFMYLLMFFSAQLNKIM